MSPGCSLPLLSVRSVSAVESFTTCQPKIGRGFALPRSFTKTKQGMERRRNATAIAAKRNGLSSVPNTRPIPTAK